MTTDRTTTGRGRAALTARARLDHAETKLAAAGFSFSKEQNRFI